MNTTRREFLRTALLGLAAAPLVAKGFASHEESRRLPEFDGIEELSMEHDANVHSMGIEDLPQKNQTLVLRPVGVAVKVPANRRVCYDYVSTGGVQKFICYTGDWDGKTFKLEPGCDNPAYILADLTERAGGEVDWQSIYQWGRYCDEPYPYKPEERRFTCNVVIDTPEKADCLRESLTFIMNHTART